MLRSISVGKGTHRYALSCWAGSSTFLSGLLFAVYEARVFFFFLLFFLRMKPAAMLVAQVV